MSRQRESSECLKALILLDKTGLAAMTFNQVVRGSSPRCLMNERGLQTLIKYRFVGLFVILRYVSFAAGVPQNLSRQRVVKHIFGAVSRHKVVKCRQISQHDLCIQTVHCVFPLLLQVGVYLADHLAICMPHQLHGFDLRYATVIEHGRVVMPKYVPG